MNGIFTIVSALIFLLGMFVIMLRLNWQLTLLALLVCPFLYLAIWLLNRKITSAARYSAA